MKISNVDTIKDLNKLYNSSALTMEGLTEESIPQFVEWIEAKSNNKVEEIHLIKGSVMNNFYSLKGDQAYSDELNLVSIVLEKPNELAIAKIEVGAIWFDDIIDNFSRRKDMK